MNRLFKICVYGGFAWVLLYFGWIGLKQQIEKDNEVAAQKTKQKYEQALNAPPPSQMIVTLVMPAYAKAEQTDINLWKKNPEAYADQFNRNNGFYNQTLTLAYNDYSVKVGDTLQLQYVSHYDPPQNKDWYLISKKPPFYESRENGQYTYVENLKGVVTELK